MSAEIKPILKALTKNDLSTLTPEQLRMLDIWTICDETIRLYGVSRESVNIIMTRLEPKYEHKYSVNIIFRWIAQAQQIFGSKEYINKDYWRQVILERLWKVASHLEHQLLANVPALDENGQPKKNEDGSIIMEPAPLGAKETNALVKVYAEISALLKLDEPDDMVKPEDEYDTLIITPKPMDIGYKEVSNLPEKLYQRLIALGAQQDEDGNWK